MSIAEEQKQRAGRPEPPKQLGLHHANQGGKCSQTSLENTWPKLLNEDNFGLQRDIQGEVWATPAWTHCLEYEYQLRKEALRLCLEEGFSIQGARWSACADLQHRMKHLIQVLAIANCRSSSSNADQQKVATLDRKVAELERKNRFGPPPQRAIKGTGKMNKSAPFAIQHVSPAEKGGGKSKAIKGKGNKGKANKGKGTKGKGTGKTEYVIGTGSSFDDLMASPGALQRLHRRNQNPPGFCCNLRQLPEVSRLRRMQHSPRCPRRLPLP